MTLRVRRKAQRQIRVAALWYEARQPGLGVRFLDEIDRLLDRIAGTPAQFPLISVDVRRGFAHTFPFGAYFVIIDNDVVVLAVLHMRRRPREWKRR